MVLIVSYLPAVKSVSSLSWSCEKRRTPSLTYLGTCSKQETIIIRIFLNTHTHTHKRRVSCGTFFLAAFTSLFVCVCSQLAPFLKRMIRALSQNACQPAWDVRKAIWGKIRAKGETTNN